MSSNDVFIVHGRNDTARDSVARFIKHLGYNPIILFEQASAGLTLIEKLERYSDVAYSVVLLTADDVGGLKDSNSTQLRARQNVIFELGYFVGKLGRGKVCLLHEAGAEIESPSDFDGVVYVTLDPPGAWKQGLAREMREAGLTIDGNRIINM